MEMKCPECGATTTSRYVCGSCGKAIFIQRPAAAAPGAEPSLPAISIPATPPAPPPPAPPPPPRPPPSPRAISLPAAPPPPPEPATQRVATERTPTAEHSFDFAHASGGAPDEIPLPHGEGERVITDPEMELPSPAGGKYVFSRPAPGADGAMPSLPDASHEMHDLPLPEGEQLESVHSRETAALDGSRKVQSRRRSLIASGVIVVLLVAMGGVYLVAMKLQALHVGRGWMADTKISSQVSLAIATGPSRDAVTLVCSAIAAHGTTVAQELRKAGGKVNAKAIEEAVGHWEALEDGRVFMGSKAVPADAADLMTKCAVGSHKVGAALSAFADAKPPADTVALETAASELEGLLSGQEIAHVAVKAPFDARTVRAPEKGDRFEFVQTPTSLAEARTLTKELHTLGPDRRFVRALQDLHLLLVPKTTTYVVKDTQGADGRVHLAAPDGKEILAVSSDADYPELTAALATHARELIKLPTATITSVPSSNGPVLVDTAMFFEFAAVNSQWAKRDLGVTTRAAHAGVSLAFQLNDATRYGDNPTARAWALLAIARAYGGGWDADEALLASTLGYRRAALDLTSRLGVQDAVRAFLLDDEGALRHAAEARRATPGVRYLWARHVAEAGSGAAVDDLLEFSQNDSDSAQAYVALAARRGRQEQSDEGAVRAIRLELRDLRRLAVADPKARAKATAPSASELNGRVLELYSAAVGKLLGPSLPAPFDVAVQQDASRSRFFTALDVLADVRVVHGHRTDAGTEFLDWLGAAPNSLSGFQTWVSSLVKARKSDEQQGMLLPMGGVAGGTEAETATLIDRTYDADSAATPAALGAVQDLVRLLDSRPSNLEILLRFEPLVVDPVLRERVTRRLTLLRGTEEERARLATYVGDSAEWDRLEQDPRVPLALRLEASRLLIAADKLGEDEANDRVHSMAEGDKPVPVLVAVADWFCDRESAAEATATLQPWLDEHPKDANEDARRVRRALARSLRLQNKAKEALEVLKPALENGGEDVQYEAALSSLALGQKDDVKKWSEKLRHHDTDTGDLHAASVAWRTGNRGDAAQILKGHEKDAFWSKRVAPVLAESLRGRPPEEEKATVEALTNTVSNSALRALVTGLMRDQHPALAAAIMVKVPAKSAAEIVEAFPVIEAGQGAAAARKWLAARPPAVDAFELVESAYRRNADGLVLAVPESAGDPGRAELFWFLKAAAAVRSKVKAGDDYTLVRKHFESSKSDDLRVRTGRFILGIGKEDSLFQKEDPTFDELTSAAFSRGVVAEGAGKLEEAAMHYLDAVRFHAALDAEGGLALHRLRTWRDADKSLARIAAEGL